MDATRRWILSRSGAVALAGSLAGCATGPREAAKPGLGNTLVLVELNGGNDGLNTVVPWTDPLYARLRPRIGLAADDVVKLDDRLALHPGLAPLRPAWDAGELAIVLGVGYEKPNLSHFRSIEIWDTASDSAELRQDGWVARALAPARSLPGRAAEGVVFGRPAIGPLLGAHARAVVMQDPGGFAQQARFVSKPAMPATASPALQHVVATQADLRAAGDRVYEKISQMRIPLATQFPRSGIGSQMNSAARLIAAGIDVPVIKVSHGSFDTHTFQRNAHDRLMAELGAALAAFRRAMDERNAWGRVTVMTYAEFGRRPAENSAQGTDHGTAAPHFVLGGAVKGGFQGRQPSLADLDSAGNLKPAVEFRSLYATALARWWGIDPVPVLGRRFDPVDVFV